MSEEIKSKLFKENREKLLGLRDERILANEQETEEDVVLNISLRPKKLAEFIGHKEIVDNLKISIQAAKQRKEPL